MNHYMWGAGEYWSLVYDLQEGLKYSIPAGGCRSGEIAVGGSTALFWYQDEKKIGPTWDNPRDVDVFVCGRYCDNWFATMDGIHQRLEEQAVLSWERVENSKEDFLHSGTPVFVRRYTFWVDSDEGEEVILTFIGSPYATVVETASHFDFDICQVVYRITTGRFELPDLMVDRHVRDGQALLRRDKYELDKWPIDLDATAGLVRVLHRVDKFRSRNYRFLNASVLAFLPALVPEEEDITAELRSEEASKCGASVNRKRCLPSERAIPSLMENHWQRQPSDDSYRKGIQKVRCYLANTIFEESMKPEDGSPPMVAAVGESALHCYQERECIGPNWMTKPRSFDVYVCGKYGGRFEEHMKMWSVLFGSRQGDHGITTCLVVDCTSTCPATGNEIISQNHYLRGVFPKGPIDDEEAVCLVRFILSPCKNTHEAAMQLSTDIEAVVYNLVLNTFWVPSQIITDNIRSHKATLNRQVIRFSAEMVRTIKKYRALGFFFPDEDLHTVTCPVREENTGKSESRKQDPCLRVLVGVEPVVTTRQVPEPL